MCENASDLFFWHREVRNRTTFLERSIRKIGKSAQEETIWEKRPPVGEKSKMRGRELRKKTSCGRKIQNERKRTEEKDLLWEENLI